MLWKSGAIAALVAAAFVDAYYGLFNSPGLYPWTGWAAFACVLLPALAWLRPHRVAAALAATACVTFTVLNPLDKEFGLAEALALTGVLAVTAHRARSWRDAPLLGWVVIALVTQPVRFPLGSTEVTLAMGLLVVATAVLALTGYLRLLGNAREKQVAAVQAEQRAEFARDLHDFVGHHLTGMVVLAQGASRIVERDPARAKQALGRIEEAGGEAMSAMRRMVGVLRDDVPVAPVTGIADIEPLVEAEPRATLEVHGDTADLPLEVVGSVHRVVMEALTNIRKHAAEATEVDVRIQAAPGWVTVKVADDGRPARQGHGFGLIGLTERVQALGGRIKAGPGVDGGWVVDVALPTRRATA
ncbi:Signal transduction histidine kinase [Lentzea xinjiangensis]|uniref:histidine kinase n=1 Tax=Lentzea xinjiangensis TaxID=402600 RepID=A0A1H9GBQ4_9PSEU|nr:histidine kinase [Lentzea xinjiangensis]SEQ47516.1 Signal transduction histidine kinase [Lentzea xinjiangensis]